jgi:alcohol dehydrogenase (cytochrome c)
MSYLGVAVVVSVLGVSVSAQKGNQTTDRISNPYNQITPQPKAAGPTINDGTLLPKVDAASSSNWVLHSLDVGNGRYSTLDQINTSNVKSIAARWLFHTGVVKSGFNDVPIVVDGVMYVTDGQGSAYALNAATGIRIWKYDVSNLIAGGEFGITNRGCVYGDGVIYVAAGPAVFAIDAKTGQGIESFGPNGEAQVLKAALQDKYPDLSAPISLGYALTMAPQYYNGVIYVGATLSERHIPGGIFMAIDAKTGKLLWKFNTVPQGPEDEGWEIAKDTWVGGVRNGGGLWETPAIDPALGTIYIAVANPSPDLDGSARRGINLFTNSIVALNLATGKLQWYFQQVHHDLWDYDSAASPILFEFQKNGQTVRAVAEASKSGVLTILDRATGKPINPIVEAPVPTATDVPGDEVWPTQPQPMTASGKPMAGVVPLHPINIPPEFQSRVVPFYTPLRVNDLLISAPGTLGGSNFAPASYSPQTGLIYVTGVDNPVSFKVRPVGATVMPGQSSLIRDSVGPTGRTPTGYVSAYDPATNELVWQVMTPGLTQSGVVVTQGNLVFVGDGLGFFYAFDARTGAQLYQFNTGSGISAAPMVYQINGEEFVAVATGGSIRQGASNISLGDTIIAFTLPKQ